MANNEYYALWLKLSSVSDKNTRLSKHEISKLFRSSSLIFHFFRAFKVFRTLIFICLILLFGLIHPAPTRRKGVNAQNKPLNDSTLSLKRLSVSENPTVVIFFDDGFYCVYQYAYPILKSLKMPISLGVIASNITPSPKQGSVSDKNNPNQKNRSPYSFLAQNEIQEMIDSLSIEIASHSVSHSRLIEMSDTMLIKYELVVSKRILESTFGQEVITFVYPYGKYDDRIIRMASYAGYKIGRTCEFGVPNFWVAPFKVPIKEVRDTTPVQVILDHIKRYDQTVLLFHRIVPQPQFFTDYSVSRFDSLLTALAQLRVNVYTLRGLYDNWCREVLERAILERGLFAKDYWLNYLFKKVDIDLTRTPSRF